MVGRGTTEVAEKEMSASEQKPQPTPVSEPVSWRSRLLWFVGLWTVSVLSLGAVSMLLRWVLLGG